MDRELQTAIGSAIGNQLGIYFWFCCFQFRQNIAAAFSGKDKRPPGIPKAGSLIVESSQFIRQSQSADSRTDIVHSTEQVSKMSNSRNAGTAPWICAAASGNRRQKQLWRRYTLLC